MSMRSNAIVQIIESLKLLDSGRSRALKPVIVGILKWMEGKQVKLTSLKSDLTSPVDLTPIQSTD